MKAQGTRAGVGCSVIVAVSMLFPTATGAWAQEAGPRPVEPVAREAKVAGEDVPVPNRKKYVAPEYPTAAAAAGIRGIVILEILIGENGKVADARVTRSIPGLDEAAVAAVRLWEYEPTKLAGKPVKVLLAQSITFALKLPVLELAPGIPELKSGGAPPVPASLATPQNASVEVTLGSQGEVLEAAVLDGNTVLAEALLRAVKSWRFVVSEGATPPSFTIQAEWNPSGQPNLTLKGVDPKVETPAASAAPAAAIEPANPPVASASLSSPSPAPTAPAGISAAGAARGPTPPATPSVDTEVLPARPAPPVKEQGVSAVADIVLGDNIPDLVRGRRPTWPPLARLGSVTGEVVVRFSVDLAGKVTVHSAEGAELLKDSAEQAVGTWLFRRTLIDRLHLIATFALGPDRSWAKVERAAEEPPEV